MVGAGNEMAIDWADGVVIADVSAGEVVVEVGAAVLAFAAAVVVAVGASLVVVGFVGSGLAAEEVARNLPSLLG